MILYLGPLGGRPAVCVLGQRLLASSRVCRNSGSGQSTPVASHSQRRGIMRAVATSDEESG
eukprot:5829648-Pleurochrysis_carterae.AAC.1